MWYFFPMLKTVAEGDTKGRFDQIQQTVMRKECRSCMSEFAEHQNCQEDKSIAKCAYNGNGIDNSPLSISGVQICFIPASWRAGIHRVNVQDMYHVFVYSQPLAISLMLPQNEGPTKNSGDSSAAIGLTCLITQWTTEKWTRMRQEKFKSRKDWSNQRKKVGSISFL